MSVYEILVTFFSDLVCAFPSTNSQFGHLVSLHGVLAI